MANGLDMRGAMDGFMKGYSFMQGQEDRKDNKARQERLDQENRDYRAQSQQNWETSRTDNLAAREQSQANTDRAFGLNMQQFNQTKEHNQWSRNRTDNQDEIAAQERLHKQNLEIIQRGYQLAAEGVPFSDEFYQVVESSPRYAQLIPEFLLSPETGAAIEQGKAVMDPDNPAQMNDPKSIKAMNVFYESDINSDREGNPLEGKRNLVSMYPGKQEKTVVGAVELEGEVNPITTGRGTEKDGDNTVLQQPVGAMIQKLSAADKMRQLLLSENGQKAARRRGQALGFIPKDKSPEYQIIKGTEYNEYGAKTGESPVGVFDKTTGEMRGLNIPSSQKIDPTIHQEIPPAAQHKGRTLVDPKTGKELVSDGQNWVPIK